MREREATHLTQGGAELLEVDKAVLVVVYEPADPKREAVAGGADRPGLQQGEQEAELLEAQLVLVQVGLAGVVVHQRRAVYHPVAAEEMLPLRPDTNTGSQHSNH